MKVCDHCKRPIFDFEEFITSKKDDHTEIYRHNKNHGAFNCWKYRKLRTSLRRGVDSFCVEIKTEFDLPEGLRCIVIEAGTTAGNYYVDEFPSSVFTPNTIETHDAVHYGIEISPKEVY